MVCSILGLGIIQLEAEHRIPEPDHYILPSVSCVPRRVADPRLGLKERANPGHSPQTRLSAWRGNTSTTCYLEWPCVSSKRAATQEFQNKSSIHSILCQLIWHMTDTALGTAGTAANKKIKGPGHTELLLHCRQQGSKREIYTIMRTQKVMNAERKQRSQRM